MLLWIHGGARMGLYHDSKAVVVRDELLGIEQTQFVPAFLPGVETLGLGFVAFFGLMVASVVMERRVRQDGVEG